MSSYNILVEAQYSGNKTTSDLLHLHALKMKIHVCVLKILGLAMPMHMSTFHQDFQQLNF